MSKLAILLILSALGGPAWLGGGPVRAQMATSNRYQDAAQKDMASEEVALANANRDRAFLKKAVEDGLSEIQLGRLALKKSNNAEVKEFSEKMIADHTRIDHAMEPVAEHLGMSLPTEMAKGDLKTMAKLSALSDTAFDQAYIKGTLKAHQGELQAFEDEEQATGDLAVKIAVARGAELVHLHLQLAEEMAKDQGIAVKGR